MNVFHRSRSRWAPFGASTTLGISVHNPSQLTTDGRSGRLTSALTAAPAVAIAVVCCGMPLAWMAGAMCLNPDVWRELRLTQWRAGLLERTLGYNGVAAVLATRWGCRPGWCWAAGGGC